MASRWIVPAKQAPRFAGPNTDFADQARPYRNQNVVIVEDSSKNVMKTNRKRGRQLRSMRGLNSWERPGRVS